MASATRARIVNRSFVTQARHSFLDGISAMAVSSQALADLRLGQLTPREHLQGFVVRARHRGDYMPACTSEGTNRTRTGDS
ncbi:MAG: hypothetical protein DMF97_15010 [Acidobacteria bacterium]|nr:MAG: hypothetical protein DMF97_15010 [Acidobacteriota bacterium]